MLHDAVSAWRVLHYLYRSPTMHLLVGNWSGGVTCVVEYLSLQAQRGWC